MGLMQSRFPEDVRAAVEGFPQGREGSAVLRLMYLAQTAYGHMTDEAVAEVAALTGLDDTRVRGLIGFYTLYYDHPHGAFVIHYCTDLPCALRGADELLAGLCERLGIQPGETSPDGVFTLETVKCLAACDRAPMMQVNLEYFYDLTDERLDEIIHDLRMMAESSPETRPPFGVGPPSEVASGEQNERQASPEVATDASTRTSAGTSAPSAGSNG